MGHLKPPKLLPAVLLAVTLAVTTASAFSDTGSHPARESIDRWSTQYQIINGYQDGTFRPDNNVTRGAFAGILNRVMHYVDKSGAGTFSDTRGNYWQDDILRLHAAGVYLGNNGRAQPSDSITRQQAVVMIARAFRVSGISAAPPFSDADKISDYAKAQIAEMAQRGWLRGVADGAFQPAKPFTRGEFVTLLDNMISALIFSPQSFSRDVDGNVLINSQSGANLHDMEISGNLYIAPGVAGRVTLTDVEIAGGTVNFSSITPVAVGTPPALTASIVFRVANGAWNDGSTEDVVLSLGARTGGRLTLHASDIPAVGAAPFSGFKAEGSWSVVPVEHDLNNGDREVYTFTYASPEQYHATVTFKVVGGSWSNGTSEDIIISLAGSSPDTLGLQASDIPYAGSAPASGFLTQGTWSPSTPTAHALADGANEVYTFTYAAPDRRSAAVTFKVVNGAWNDGSTADKVVTLTSSRANDPLQLTASSIPAVGAKPASGYRNEGTWSPSTPFPHVLADGASEVFTFTYTEAKSSSATVTFKVVNGSWNSGSSSDVVVQLSDPDGKDMAFQASQIPAVGSRPASGFQAAGTWSPSVPAAHSLTNGASEVYTFTYTPLKNMTA
ncbi:MAG: S-layer homology domain-containing protein, partial [Oscillibacter sp.]|nr:S-layer homology domain-containing protein [Oscillibacter sp.]